MQIIFDKKVLKYQGTLGNPQRLVHTHGFLQKKYSFVKPEVKISEPIVHSKELIEKVKTRNFHNPDSPAYPNIYDWAILSLNSAIKAQQIQGFSFMEPPGHHAYRDSLGGFCYFNNIAEAVERSKLRTLIIDIDGHHGNGTEDIFKGRNDVFFISLHASPCYPGTGHESKDNILNYLLSPDCGEEVYLKTLNEAIEKAKKIFSFEQIAVSAGFDTYEGDLASLGLKEGSYYKIGKIIRNLSREKNSRVFAVLEGGYTKKLGELIHEFVKGMSK